MSSARPSEPRLAQRNPVNAIEGIDGPDPLDYDYTFDAITAIFLWPSAVFLSLPTAAMHRSRSERFWLRHSELSRLSYTKWPHDAAIFILQEGAIL